MKRRYDIDWLRSIGVLLLIPFHSALMFSLAEEDVVYIKGECNNQVLIISEGILNFFHMPLLFVLAGMAIIFSLRRREQKVFLMERVKKLGIPFLVGSLVLNPLFTYIYLQSQGEKIGLLTHYLDQFRIPWGDSTGRNGSYTVAHLWFILFLFVFSVVGLPLFSYLVSEKSQKFRDKLANFFEKPLALSLLIIPFMLCYLIDLLDWKNPFAYFLTIVIGCLIATDERYQKALNRDKWVYLIIGTIEITLNRIGLLYTSDSTWMGFVRDITELSARIMPVYALLGIFNTYFNKESRLIKYLSKSSYTVYLVHMLVNTAVGAVLLKLHIASGWRWLLIVAVTYGICFAVYEGLRRQPLTGLCYAFGLPPKKKSTIVKEKKGYMKY